MWRIRLPQTRRRNRKLEFSLDVGEKALEGPGLKRKERVSTQFLGFPWTKSLNPIKTTLEDTENFTSSMCFLVEGKHNPFPGVSRGNRSDCDWTKHQRFNRSSTIIHCFSFEAKGPHN
jgi:hypothetical protein